MPEELMPEELMPEDLIPCVSWPPSIAVLVRAWRVVSVAVAVEPSATAITDVPLPPAAISGLAGPVGLSLELPNSGDLERICPKRVELCQGPFRRLPHQHHHW